MCIRDSVGAARCAGAGGGVLLTCGSGALGIDGSGSAADEPPSAGSVAGRLEAGILVPPSSIVKGIACANSAELR